ncbi:MAG: hypothetical protein H0W61_11490 [Bacteroidetes bacterium]|nr:hypothetical protein [Bacteroidota bacterium]
MKSFFVFISLLISGIYHAQGECAFVKDTLTIPKENKIVNGEILQATLKNKNVIQLIKADDGKYYLKLVVSENLYFDHIDLLEIRSGKKSFYAKDTKQYALNKHTGYYVVELYKNYVGTLKEDGITSIVFNKAETLFTKQDCGQVKQIAKCFYDAISIKK